MILSFQHKGLQRYFETGRLAGVQPHHATKLRELLAVLDVASSASDLGRPSWRYHELKGELQDYASLTVNGNWCIIFRWHGHDVESGSVDIGFADRVFPLLGLSQEAKRAV